MNIILVEQTTHWIEFATCSPYLDIIDRRIIIADITIIYITIVPIASSSPSARQTYNY